MVCSLSLSVAIVFIVGMIYMNCISNSNDVIKNYREKLSSEMQEKYDKISNERASIYFQGYGIGLLFSLIFIIYNYAYKKEKLKWPYLFFSSIAICFIVNYFYYKIYPKSDWLLNYVKTPEETKAWLNLYKELQKNYHIGLVIGLAGVGILAMAFRC
jgi:glucan phosphoethanolaminetransferase (alkaline phosphatase superfamily)